LATAKFLTHFIISIAVLENVPLSRVTEKSNFSILNVGLARTGNRTRATCMAGSVSRRSAIHYAFLLLPSSIMASEDKGQRTELTREERERRATIPLLRRLVSERHHQ
jgi:hypothetical protein